MKIKRSRKSLFIVAVIALAITGAVIVYFLYANSNNYSTDTGRAESDIQQASRLAEDPENKNLSPNSDQPATPTVKESSGKKNVRMIASTDISGSSLYIRGGLNYPILEDGSCYAILGGPSGESIRKDTGVLQNPASTDCKTISVPTNELSSGKWKVALHYSSANYEGTSNEVEFTIN